MEIKRVKYLNKLKENMHNGLVKIITGMRRCGKSYLLNNIFYNFLLSIKVPEDHIIKFAFDSADDLKQIGEDFVELAKNKQFVDPKKFLVYINNKIIDNNRYYLLLDEIQNLSSFEIVLISFLKKENIDIYVTGSNSKFLSSDVATEFAGRGYEIHVFPLSFREFYSALGGEKNEAYKQYSMFGGLPQIVSLKTDKQKRDYLSTLVKEVYLKDIIVHNNLKNNSNIEELLKVIASCVGFFTNPSKLESTFKSVKKESIWRETIENYISYFVNSFLISKAFRNDVKGKKYIYPPYKLYFEDIGLHNAILNFRQYEPTHIMENIVYNEIKYHDFGVDVGMIKARKKINDKIEWKNYEIDFIALDGSKKIYIQSAYSISSEEKWLKEIHPFNKLKDAFKKIIIVKDPIVLNQNSNGYLVSNLFDFLLSNDILR